MRIIDRIEEIVHQMSGHFDQFEEEFERQNDIFKELLESDHDTIGLVLKFHLIVEHYLTDYLSDKFKGVDITNGGLSFFQKTKLLSDQDFRAAFVKPGILELNKIRNKFGHTLQPNVSLDDQREMLKVLAISRKEVVYENPLHVIADFATVACTFLIVSPKEITDLWQEFFDELHKSQSKDNE